MNSVKEEIFYEHKINNNKKTLSYLENKMLIN